ncbi:hypothetical protein ACS0TY_032158 [Phlomoides rotata]
MDGYNQYGWNHGFYQNEMVYPPQNGEFGYDNRRNFDYHYQMPQVPSYYQDWENNEDWSHATPSNDFQPQQEFDPSISSSHDERPSTEEMLMLIYKGIKERNAKCDEFMKLNNGKIKSIEFQISQLSIVVEKLQEEDEEQSGEGPSECKSEDDNLIVEVDQEECPLMDMGKNEQENQEASNDTLKSEMSVSKPLNSSICTFFDNDVSIGFILPLDSFDHKKEVEKSLGILEPKGGGWKEMLRSYVEEKLSTNGMGDQYTWQDNLLHFEAQRLRYNGKEDRYPWPFR